MNGTTEPIRPWRFEELGLKIEDKITWDEWRELGSTVKTINRRALFAVGDWAIRGEQIFGEQWSQEIGDHSIEQIKQAHWVCSQITLSRRNPNLSFSHHRAVASLSPVEQVRVLKQAEDTGWSTRQIEAEVRKIKNPPNPANDALPSPSAANAPPAPPQPAGSPPDARNDAPAIPAETPRFLLLEVAAAACNAVRLDGLTDELREAVTRLLEWRSGASG